MLTIGLTHYLVVGAVFFCAGLFTMMTKRNAIGILIGVELVLNSANINLVAFDRFLGPGKLDGQIVAVGPAVLEICDRIDPQGIGNGPGLGGDFFNRFGDFGAKDLAVLGLDDKNDVIVFCVNFLKVFKGGQLGIFIGEKHPVVG